MHLPQVQYRIRCPLPNMKNNQALYVGRDLAQLEVLRVTHAGDQLLRLFAQRIKNSSILFKSSINELRFG